MFALVPVLLATVTGSVGLSLAPLVGKHVESDGAVTLSPIPIPIAQATVRSGPFEIAAESLPGSPAITERESRYDTLSTHLAFVDAVVRAYVPGNRFWAGAGEIVYNQKSDYTTTIEGYNISTGTIGPRSFTTSDASRVAGGRYEAGAGFGRNADRVRFAVDLMPSLTGLVREYFEGRAFRGGNAPERGAQFETNLAITDPHPSFSFQYGVRYVNFSTEFTQSGRLSDHNVGFLPYATFNVNVGR